MLFLSISETVGVCPTTDSIKPCVCLETIGNHRLICSGNHTLDLVKVFQTLSHSLKGSEKHINIFHLNSTSVKELRENTFKDITFDEVSIESNKELKTIDENAFKGTESVIKYLDISNNPALHSPNNSIFNLINKLPNLSILELQFNNISEIPSNAFIKLNHLGTINLAGNSIKKLGHGAFSKLPNLGQVGFEQVHFPFTDHAFQFEHKSNDPFLINLENNPDLTNSAFSEKTFLNINRHTQIRFGHGFQPGSSRHMIYLAEKVFLPFLFENDRNTIDMNGSEFDCTDCRNYWLKKNPNVLPRIYAIRCHNRKAFNDPGNFLNCSS